MVMLCRATRSGGSAAIVFVTRAIRDIGILVRAPPSSVAYYTPQRRRAGLMGAMKRDACYVSRPSHSTHHTGLKKIEPAQLYYRAANKRCCARIVLHDRRLLSRTTPTPIRPPI